ncbi:MAG: glucose 1-dehydrogenase [Rickettsiales bacterium]|jgi:NAD(P)-dependent dehydrogenase (short-subunit alcohol dehydrogenase family)
MPTNRFDLSGKIALVTGGSRGLGRQMALAFAEVGADVAIASRKIESCEETAKEIEALGVRAFPVAAHVGYWDQCDALIEAVYEKFGRIDILVNNAGLSPLYPSLAEIEESLYDKVFDINLKGPFRLATQIGTRMVADGGGSIINVSSTASFFPSRRAGTYGMAKAGLNHLTRTLAHEYGPTVRVNCIVPGPFATDISKAWPDTPEFNARWEKLAMKRVGQPEEIVGAALYFASEASSYTTGAILRVCGGTEATDV